MLTYIGDKFYNCHITVVDSMERPTCYHCKAVFEHPPDLYKHTTTHTCSLCHQSFCQLSYLNEHLKNHTTSPHSCTKCSKTFADRAERVKHMTTHTEAKTMIGAGKRTVIRLYSCTNCGKKFGTMEDAATHIKTHSQNVKKQYFELKEDPDIKPQMVTQATSNLQNPTPNIPAGSYQIVIQRIKSGETLYKCSHCDDKFYSLSAATSHILGHKTNTLPHEQQALYGGSVKREEMAKEPPSVQTINGTSGKGKRNHSEISILNSSDTKKCLVKSKPHRCLDCGKRFKTADRLTKHKMKHKEVQNMCSTCGLKCRNSWILKQHMRSHKATMLTDRIDKTKKKSHTCSFCSRGFSRKNDLKRHMMIHTGQKPLQCSVCSKTYVRPCDLREHIQLHPGEKPYKCSDCGKQFLRAHHLRKHMVSHIRGTAYTCFDCGKRFTQSGFLSTHKMSYTGQKSHKCPVHSKRFTLWRAEIDGNNTHKGVNEEADRSRQERSKMHVRNVQQEESAQTLQRRHEDGSRQDPKTHQCSVCTKSCDSLSSIKLHKLVHKGEKQHQCPVCDKNYTQAAYLQQHMKTHRAEKLYGCSHCGKEFTKSGNLKTHIMTHKRKKAFSCSECGKQFSSRCTLNDHMKFHSGEKLFPCSYCGKKFPQMGNLKEHILIHTGEKPHECSECGKQFTLAGAVKKHLMTHTGEKPYKCSHCGKQFTLAHQLKSHMLVHTGDTPYSCSDCGKRFKWLGSLNAHSVTHTGEKPYKCSQCDKQFTSLCNLRTHMRIYCIIEPLKSGKQVRGLDDHNSAIRPQRRPKAFQCARCTQVFSTAKSLKTHRKRNHSAAKVHLCHHCNTGYGDEINLKEHIILHTGQNYSSCATCVTGFLQPQDVHNHLATHISVPSLLPCAN